MRQAIVIGATPLASIALALQISSALNVRMAVIFTKGNAIHRSAQVQLT